MTNTEWLRSRLLARVDTSPIGSKTENLDELRISEWVPQFESLMRDRLLVGRFRYGRVGEKGKPQYDRISSAIRRLITYQDQNTGGNKELLVDVANLCMMEFVEGQHPNSHFHAQDDGSEHAQTLK